MPPTSVAGLLSLAGHPGIPASSAAAVASSAAAMGGLHALAAQQHRPPLPGSAPPVGGDPAGVSRDGKPTAAGLQAAGEERLKHSASASPHGSATALGPVANAAGRPRSAGPRSPRASTPNEESLSKRIKTEDGVRKSGHVS